MSKIYLKDLVNDKTPNGTLYLLAVPEDSYYSTLEYNLNDDTYTFNSTKDDIVELSDNIYKRLEYILTTYKSMYSNLVETVTINMYIKPGFYKITPDNIEDSIMLYSIKVGEKVFYPKISDIISIDYKVHLPKIIYVNSVNKIKETLMQTPSFELVNKLSNEYKMVII